MKKLALVLAIVFAGFMSANAQVWIGGGMGADLKEKGKSFNVAPEVGFMIPHTPFTVAVGANYQNTGGKNELSLQPYFRYAPITIGEKFVLFFDVTGDFNLLDAKKDAYAVMLQPGIAWMATEKWTAAFRFAKIGYDHNFYSTDGFLMNFDLAAPSIRIYYNF